MKTPSGDLTFEHFALPDAQLPRWSLLGVYIEDNLDELCITSRYAANMFPVEAVKRMIEDIRTTALAIISDPSRTVSSFAQLVKDYAGRQNPDPREMSEFVVVGSSSIPQIPESAATEHRLVANIK